MGWLEFLKGWGRAVPAHMASLCGRVSTPAPPGWGLPPCLGRVAKGILEKYIPPVSYVFLEGLGNYAAWGLGK